MSGPKAVDYCGCCGNRCSGTALWCGRCEKHVLPAGALWDRTWYAQKKEPCPFTDTPGGGYGSGEVLVCMPRDVAQQHFQERMERTKKNILSLPLAERARVLADFIEGVEAGRVPAQWCVSLARHLVQELESRS